MQQVDLSYAYDIEKSDLPSASQSMQQVDVSHDNINGFDLPSASHIIKVSLSFNVI